MRETVNHPCDARRNCTELVAEFPTIDFSGCAEQDPVWPNYERRFIGSSADPFQPRESADVIALAARARRALGWLAARPEKEVVIVSHRVIVPSASNLAPWQPFRHISHPSLPSLALSSHPRIPRPSPPSLGSAPIPTQLMSGLRGIRYA